MKLCIACLIGMKCRYDGKSKSNKNIILLLKKEVLVPICPEQMRGLPTPREVAEQRKNRVLIETGKDVTENLNKGAEEVLNIAKLFCIKEAILKQRSPSCGCGQIFDGSFSGKVIEGDGITTALLKRNKIKVISDENY